MIYSHPPPPMASIRSLQLEEPHTLMVASSVVEVSILELLMTPSISNLQECPVAAPKRKIIKNGLNVLKMVDIILIIPLLVTFYRIFNYYLYCRYCYCQQYFLMLSTQL